MTAVDTDIDSFIQQQKAKLANERNILNNSDKMNSAEYRQRWRDQHRLGSVKRPKWGPPAPVEPLNLLGSGIPEQDMAEYRRRWFELKGKHLEPGSTRKQWSSPVKLSPRGTLDTDRLILEVQREKEMNEYRESWRRQRGELQEPSPRRPQRGPSDSRPPPPPPVQRPTDQDDYRRKWQQHHAQGQEPAPYINRNLDTKGKNMMAALDTESIIQQVVKEKREKEEREARQNNNVLVGGGGGGGPASNRGANPPRVSGSPAPAMDKDTYKRLWAQQNSQRRGPFEPTSSTRNKKDSNVPRLDTDALIAEVMAEKLEEENQKLRQERQQLEAAKHPEGLRHLKHEALALDSPEGLPLGGYEEHRKKLDEERRKEYLELQRRKAGQQAWDQKPGASSEGLLIKADPGQERLQQLKEERNLEYKQLLAQKRKLPTPERYGLPREVDEAEDFGMLHNLGARDKEMPKQGDPPASQLKLSGHGIMDNAIRRDYPPRSLREQTDEYKAATFGSNESDAAKLQKIKKRNEEYNQFLASKAEKQGQRRAGEGGQGEGGVYATIPGLRYSTSAQKKRELQDERNREYNEMLRNKATRGQRSQPPAAPKQGWGTPTYEEMLDKKRAQESQYRKANDLNFEGDHNVKETERRISELDREVATKQDILRRKKQYAGILEDPDWLSPRHYLVPDQSRGLSEPRRGNQQDGQYFATLPLGSQPVDEQSRRKEEYKRDLQRQMAEAQLARKTERAHGILVNNNNLANEQLTSPRLLYSDLTPRRRPDLELEAYHSKILDGINKLDNATPRGRASLGRRPPSSDRRGAGGLNLGLGAGPAPAGGRQGALAGGGGGGGILDLGFDSVLGGPRLTTIEPPAGLQYQPSTYITANNVPTLNTSVDEAYNFYASLNPLDPSLANAAPAGGRAGEREGGGGRGGGGGGRQGVPPLELDGIGGDRASKVRFADSRRNRPGPATGMDFGTDEDRKRDQREQQNAYREELERQMVEKNIKKEREREERERYEKKMEEEARNYDPFGKGGGGAPMRDQHGNVISDLRQMRSDNINRGNDQYTPRFAPPPSYSPELQLSGRGGAGGNATRAANSYRDDLIGPPPVQTTAEGETSHARGGHGIFGMPKTEAEKTQADRYKSELKRQIEEKKMEEMRKKEQQRLEEEREQRILDEQRAKMQQEYEMEQAKIKAKEEEARKKNEEMMRAAEEKKLELERKRREADEDRQRQLREEREREQQESLKSVSPPVPATRTKTATPDQGSRLANPSYGRPQSSDVLNQLANMRAQLQNERRRVQTMLDDQEDEVEIYDPRQVQRPPPGPVLNSRPEIDVFETAMTRNPVAVRRTPADRHHPDRQIAEEFQSLKHKGTDSRKHLRARYPDEPITDSALEHQQDALIRRQEDQLRGGRDHGLALDDRRDMRSSSSQLHSNSAFVEVNNLGHFPDDFEDMPRRNDSARHRRRNRLSSSPRVLTPDFNSRATFGSQTSLNVDRLARKNEERLRKLRDLQGDDVSLYDPEDVLDRFMTKQAHNRPPSRNTLLDDTWLRAGSKQSKY